MSPGSGMEPAALSQRDQKRQQVLEMIESGTMSVSDGAAAMGLSTRQVARLRIRYAAMGAMGLIHGSKGRKPAHAIADEVKQEVVRLYRSRYDDLNFTRFAERLRDDEGVCLSDSSVRRILTEAGIVSKAAKRRKSDGALEP